MTKHMLWPENNMFPILWNICAQISFAVRPIGSRNYFDAVLVTSAENLPCDINEEEEEFSLFGLGIGQPTMTLTKSEKFSQMNKIYFTYFLAFSLVSSLI